LGSEPSERQCYSDFTPTIDECYHSSARRWSDALPSSCLSLAALALGAFSILVVAQEPCDKQFVVSQVSLPTTTRLSQSEQAAIRADLIGRCFDDRWLSGLAGSVRDKLQSFGYLRAAVSEPTLTIADASRDPQPISVAVEVKEGARYKVREVEWWNLKAVSLEQIMAVSPIQIDDVVDMSKV
jgi:hypothetical protein